MLDCYRALALMGIDMKENGQNRRGKVLTLGWEKLKCASKNQNAIISEIFWA